MSLEPPPSQERSDLFGYVENAVDQRLDQFEAWPANIFKLELESAGIYQNFSGRCLLELLSEDEVARENVDGYPYMMRDGADVSLEGTRVKEATETFYNLPDHDQKPTFPELTLYTALAREKELLNDAVPIDIHPKGHYTPLLRGIDNEIDGLLYLNQEYFPLQVYNGIQLITEHDADGRRDKVVQAEEVSTQEDPPSNPVLVSHLASENVRDIMRAHNGTVIDTQKLIACEETNPDLANAAKFLNVRDRVEFVPRLETSYGLGLDGKRFDELVNEVPNAIIPRKVAPAATQLPDWYRKIVRGGLHLIYVNTFYRRTDDRTEREASILLQEAFHHLLRSDHGMDLDQFIDEGWNEFRQRYKNIKYAQRREQPIRQQAREYVSTLRDHNVIIRSGDTIYARASDHPHSSLSFPSGY
jgi:hypothetical protein